MTTKNHPENSLFLVNQQWQLYKFKGEIFFLGVNYNLLKLSPFKT